MVESYQTQYWADVLGDALCEVDKFDLFTSEEMTKIGKYLASAADGQSQAFGWDVASSNRSAELREEEETLRKELRRERDKVTCRECNGHGRLSYDAGPWAVNTECSKCRGEGRHDP